MTLTVPPLSKHHQCLLLKTWQWGKESLFLQIHSSLRPGEYKTQVWSIVTYVIRANVIPIVLLLKSLLCITGSESWPHGVQLKYTGGDQFGHVNTVMVKSLTPHEISDVSVQMQSPPAPGMYQGQWRMCTATGLFFGGRRSPVTQFVSDRTAHMWVKRNVVKKFNNFFWLISESENCTQYRKSRICLAQYTKPQSLARQLSWNCS